MSSDEERQAIEVAAQMAQRDQNDADVQEVARQLGVFCRGLDEAGVVHSSAYSNRDRTDAIQFFVLTEMGRLRSKQEGEE